MDLSKSFAFCVDHDLLLQNVIWHPFRQKALSPFVSGKHQTERFCAAGIAFAYRRCLLKLAGYPQWSKRQRILFAGIAHSLAYQHGPGIRCRGRQITP